MRGRDHECDRDDEVSDDGYAREDSFEDRFEDDDYGEDIPEREGSPRSPQEEEDEEVTQTDTKPKGPRKHISTKEKNRQQRLKAKLKRKNSIPMNYSEWKELIAQRKQELYFKMAAGSQKIQKEPHWTKMRVRVANFISTHFYEAFMGAVILGNMFIIMMETERRCYCEDPNADSCPANAMDIWVPDLICLVLYIVELMLKMYVYQCKFFRIPWNVFDFFVVALTIAGEMLGGHAKDAVIIRVVRITRLARMLRLLTIFQELYLMLAGMASTLRTIFWAVIMLIAVLSVCALIAVEILKPVAAAVEKEGGFDEYCDRCPRSFESVSSSIITFFQTLIMGEGIDDIMIPLIEADWMAGLFIFCAVAMVYLGISNLILSVIVEKASEARTQDAFYQSMVHKKLKADAKKVLMEFTQDADMDMNNSISLDELRNAYRTQELFRNYFKNMDMDLPFLEYCLRSRDKRGKGECSFEDFADAVIQMRNVEIGPMVTFMRHQLGEVLDEVATLSDQIQGVGRDLSSHISQVGQQAAHTISTIPRPEAPKPPPGIAASLFGGTWWATMGGSDDEEDYGYNEVSYKRPFEPKDMLDDGDVHHDGQDLGHMLKRAYDEPLPLDLPNLNTAQQRFAELCERTEAQLARLESHCRDAPLAPARKELFVVCARLMNNLSTSMPRLLDGASAPLPPPPGYPPLPPIKSSRAKMRKKRQEEASETASAWDGPGSWDEMAQDHKHAPPKEKKPRHNEFNDPPEVMMPKHISSKLADVRAKNDLAGGNGRQKDKKKKKGKGSSELVV